MASGDLVNLTFGSKKRVKADKKSSIIMQYIEGESDSSNEEDTNVVEIEHDNVDTIEDVELDGGSEDDDDMSSEKFPMGSLIGWGFINTIGVLIKY